MGLPEPKIENHISGTLIIIYRNGGVNGTNDTNNVGNKCRKRSLLNVNDLHVIHKRHLPPTFTFTDLPHHHTCRSAYGGFVLLHLTVCDKFFHGYNFVFAKQRKSKRLMPAAKKFCLKVLPNSKNCFQMFAEVKQNTYFCMRKPVPAGNRAASLWEWRFQTLIFEDTNFTTSNPTIRLGNEQRLRFVRLVGYNPC